MSEAFNAVITGHAALRSLAAALAADPNALARGAPPMAGRLVFELIARGSTTFTAPSCVICIRTGYPLTRSGDGGVCARCRRRQRGGLRPLRCGQAGRRPRTATAGRSALAAPTGRGARAGFADGSVGSPAAPVMHSRTSATAATRCPRRPAAAAGGGGRARSPIRQARSAPPAPPDEPPPARAVTPSGHQPRTGPRGRSATPATPRPCATMAPATDAARPGA